MSDIILDDLVNGMKDVSLQVARLREGKSFQYRNEYERRCIWCNSLEHSREGCNDYKDALNKGIIFFRDGKIHSAETRIPLTANFRRGRMRRIIKETETSRV